MAKFKDNGGLISGGEGMNIILIPCASEVSQGRYRDTVLEGIDADVFGFKRDSKVAAWALMDNPNGPNRSRWDRIHEGDVAAFYASGHIISTARVIMKFRDNSLAEDIWGLDPKGRAWGLIFIMDSVETMCEPISPIDLGYKPKFTFQNTNVYAEDTPQHETLRGILGLS